MFGGDVKEVTMKKNKPPRQDRGTLGNLSPGNDQLKHTNPNYEIFRAIWRTTESVSHHQDTETNGRYELRKCHALTMPRLTVGRIDVRAQPIMLVSSLRRHPAITRSRTRKQSPYRQ